VAEHYNSADIKSQAVTRYKTIRPKLRSGDLFFCSGNYLISKAIRTFTKSPWSHVGIIFVIKQIDRVLLLESVEDMGVRFAPASNYFEEYEDSEPYDGNIVLGRVDGMNDKLVEKIASFGCDELTRPYDKAEIGQDDAPFTVEGGERLLSVCRWIRPSTL